MNALSITASFGALVWIFQDGNLSALLGFQPVGFVETTQPVILFCVLFGLSMDYEVFLLSRMKEVWDTTGDNTEAVARGLERSGRIVTSAALIVVVVAGLVRVRRHRPDQGARAGRGDRGGARCDRGPGAARAIDDAAPGPLELVDAGVAGAVRGQPAARVRGRGRSGRGGPMRPDPPPGPGREPASPRAAAARSWPTRRRRSPRCRHRRTAGADSADPLPVVLPRDDGPHDRLTEWWYYTGHLAARARATRSAGPSGSSTSSSAPSAATSHDLGIPPRHHR